MPSIAVRISILLLLLAPILGCHTARKRGQSPLTSARMSPQSVVVEVLRVRFPEADENGVEEVWTEVDEQHFPAELRRQLASNGFRVGFVGGRLPMKLSQLMQLSDAPPSENNSNVISVEAMEEEPCVQRKHMTLRGGRRGEICASEVYEQLPVLINDSGELGGRIFNQAQGMMAVKAFPEDDGRVRLEIVPELHHGQPQQRWVGSQGVMRLDSSRPRRVFDRMSLSANLAPGEMILLGSLPNRPGSLGHNFFTRDNGSRERQLIVVRLAQTQHQSMFSPESD